MLNSHIFNGHVQFLFNRFLWDINRFPNSASKIFYQSCFYSVAVIKNLVLNNTTTTSMNVPFLPNFQAQYVSNVSLKCVVYIFSQHILCFIYCVLYQLKRIFLDSFIKILLHVLGVLLHTLVSAFHSKIIKVFSQFQFSGSRV